MHRPVRECRPLRWPPIEVWLLAGRLVQSACANCFVNINFKIQAKIIFHMSTNFWKRIRRDDSRETSHARRAKLIQQKLWQQTALFSTLAIPTDANDAFQRTRLRIADAMQSTHNTPVENADLRRSCFRWFRVSNNSVETKDSSTISWFLLPFLARPVLLAPTGSAFVLSLALRTMPRIVSLGHVKILGLQLVPALSDTRYWNLPQPKALRC